MTYKEYILESTIKENTSFLLQKMHFKFNNVSVWSLRDKFILQLTVRKAFFMPNE